MLRSRGGQHIYFTLCLLVVSFSLCHVVPFRKRVGVVEVLVHHHTISFGLRLYCTAQRVLVTCAKNNYLVLLHVLRVGIILHRLASSNHCRFVVIPHVVSQVEVELCSLQLFQSQLFLQLEKVIFRLFGSLSLRVAFDIFLKFSNRRVGPCLIELGIGRIEIHTVRGIKESRFGVLPAWVCIIIRGKRLCCREIIPRVIVALGQQVKRLFGGSRTFHKRHQLL